MAKQSLKQAVHLAKTGKSKALATAARCLHGLPEGGWPQTQQARLDILEYLPLRDMRSYTITEFIGATYLLEEHKNAACIYRSRTDR